jgi:hypothetical protein
MGGLGITIEGKVLAHKLYHAVLPDHPAVPYF